MSRESYQKDLERLLADVNEMGEMAVKSMETAIEAIKNHDADLAKSLDEWDKQIDARHDQIEKRCLELIALQQPVAVDLRLIGSVFKMVTDLERIADMAENVAEYAMASDDLLLISTDELVNLGISVKQLVSDSIAAFRERSAEKSEEVIYRDEKIDEECLALQKEVLKQLIRSEATSHDSEDAEIIAKNAFTVFSSIRDLERIGDHAGNFAARTIYWLTASAKFI